MTREDFIQKAKMYRAQIDVLIADMKMLKNDMIGNDDFTKGCKDPSEVIGQHILSIRNLESAQMRQGKVLEYIGTPDPYPTSKTPGDPTIHPKAE